MGGGGGAGVGMSHISGQVKSLLGKITSVDQSNYPEMMGRTFIINAPGMFKFVWAIVKRFLDARTLTKIDVRPPPSPPPPFSSTTSTVLHTSSEEDLTVPLCALMLPHERVMQIQDIAKAAECNVTKEGGGGGLIAESQEHNLDGTCPIEARLSRLSFGPFFKGNGAQKALEP